MKKPYHKTARPRTPAGLLKAARALISKRSAWTQQTLARTRDGHGTVPSSSDACAWCASGAVSAFWSAMPLQYAAERFLAAAINRHDGGLGAVSLTGNFTAIVAFNDTPGRMHSDILSVFAMAEHMAREEARDAKRRKK